MWLGIGRQTVRKGYTNRIASPHNWHFIDSSMRHEKILAIYRTYYKHESHFVYNLRWPEKNENFPFSTILFFLPLHIAELMRSRILEKVLLASLKGES